MAAAAAAAAATVVAADGGPAGLGGCASLPDKGFRVPEPRPGGAADSRAIHSGIIVFSGKST